MNFDKDFFSRTSLVTSQAMQGKTLFLNFLAKKALNFHDKILFVCDGFIDNKLQDPKIIYISSNKWQAIKEVIDIINPSLVFIDEIDHILDDFEKDAESFSMANRSKNIQKLIRILKQLKINCIFSKSAYRSMGGSIFPKQKSYVCDHVFSLEREENIIHCHIMKDRSYQFLQKNYLFEIKNDLSLDFKGEGVFEFWSKELNFNINKFLLFKEESFNEEEKRELIPYLNHQEFHFLNIVWILKNHKDYNQDVWKLNKSSYNLSLEIKNEKFESFDCLKYLSFKKLNNILKKDYRLIIDLENLVKTCFFLHGQEDFLIQLFKKKNIKQELENYIVVLKNKSYKDIILKKQSTILKNKSIEVPLSMEDLIKVGTKYSNCVKQNFFISNFIEDDSKIFVYKDICVHIDENFNLIEAKKRSNQVLDSNELNLVLDKIKEISLQI